MLFYEQWRDTNAFYAAQLIPSDIPSAQELCLDVLRSYEQLAPHSSIGSFTIKRTIVSPFGGPFTHTEWSIENEAK
jgi:hypothetical protein